MANAKDVAFRVMTGVHEMVFGISNGRLAQRVGSMPVLKLTTVGRKTGKRRTTMLSSPVFDPNRIVLVASYGGDDRHPAWFLNLREHPAVEVTMRGETRAMRARVASAEEKADLWPRIAAAWRGYEQYQERTERDIPVVVLEP